MLFLEFFYPIIRVFINCLFISYCKRHFFVKIRDILNCLFVKFARSWFFFLFFWPKLTLFHQYLDFTRNFRFLAAYFLWSYLSSLWDIFFYRSILWKLKSVLNFSLERDFWSISLGVIPYFSLLTLFIFSANCKIVVGVVL